MKKAMRISSLVLTLTTVLSFTACNSKPDTPAQTTAQGSPNASTAKATATPSSPVPLTILMEGDNTPAADNIVLKELGKRTNTTINMIYVPSKDLATKLSTLAASDSLPDILPVKQNESAEFKEAGMLAEVGKLVKEYAPNIMKNVGDNLSKAAVNKDGIYVLLNAKLPYAKQLNIRTDWLKNLNMSMPTDLDSLYKVYYAFTYNDPDKDGKKDTFGLAVNSDPLNFASVFGAYGIPVKRNIELKDGTVTTWAKHPKFLDAVEYIRKLNAEGLFEPDWATITQMDMFGKLWNGVAGALEWECVGPTNNWMPGRYTEKPVPTFDFPVIKGPNGTAGVPASQPDLKTGYAFSKKCKDLTTAVKFANFCMSDEGSELLYLGVENTMFKWTEKANGKYELLDQYKDSAAHRAAGGFVYWGLFAPTNNCEVKTFNKQTQDGVAAARKLGLPEAYIISNVPTQVENGTAMDKIIQEMYAQLIVTKENPKSVYDKFIATWEKAGGTKWEKEATELYKKEKAAK